MTRTSGETYKGYFGIYSQSEYFSACDLYLVFTFMENKSLFRVIVVVLLLTLVRLTK